MAARRRKKRTRRTRSWSLLNALEAYTYGAIITENLAGTSPWGLLTGATDLSYGSLNVGAGAMTATGWSGGDEISLGDILTEPGQALSVMSNNFRSNIVPMAVQGTLVGISFRIGKRLLRRQISSVNRNIVKPMLGAGIRI